MANTNKIQIFVSNLENRKKYSAWKMQLCILFILHKDWNCKISNFSFRGWLVMLLLNIKNLGAPCVATM